MNIENYTVKFSGHQTFPLRYGWIYKAVDMVDKKRSISNQEEIEEQMILMGVGKNMVLSIRHWIKAFNLVTCTDKKKLAYELTPLARKLFVGTGSYDRYMDHIGTIWLLHWLFQTNGQEFNAFRFMFSFFNGLKTDKTQFIKDIQFILSSSNKEVNEATLKKDVDCLFQMYSHKHNTSNLSEDSFASPFTELGLVTQVDNKSYFAELSNRPSLPSEVFAFAVIEFFKRKSERTISFERLLTEQGSPGKIFRLTASGLTEKLDALEILTDGKIAWTDTQGLRQIQQHFDNISKIEPDCYLEQYYKKKG